MQLESWDALYSVLAGYPANIYAEYRISSRKIFKLHLCDLPDIHYPANATEYPAGYPLQSLNRYTKNVNIDNEVVLFVGNQTCLSRAKLYRFKYFFMF